jgi:HAD superfamily phosphoserine phosphatase-like hydrolase
LKNPNKILVLFDFDGTIITQDSFRLLLKKINISYFNFIVFLTLRFADIVFKSIKFGTKHALKEKILYFLTSQINENQDDFFDRFAKELLENYKNNLVYAELKKHKKNADAVLCIVSASPDLWIRRIAAILGTEYICTNYKYSGSRYAGEFLSKNCNGKEKADRLSEKYNKEEFACVLAYGNNPKDDAAMFEWADVAYLVRNNEIYNLKNEKKAVGGNM